MASTPRDRFDDIPDDLVRVGAHRGPRPRGRGWIAFAWAALATGILVVGGLYGLSRVNPSISFELPSFGGPGADPEATQTTQPRPEPITDPALADPAYSYSFSVLNASPTDKVQDAAVTQMQTAGWANIGSGNASVRDVEATTIYYNGAQYEAVALGMAEILGTDPARVVNSDAYPGYPITIVLGADYVPPAS